MKLARRVFNFLNKTVDKAVDVTRTRFTGTQLSDKAHLIDTIQSKVNLLKSAKPSGKPFTVVVEGNIGCGKTTMLNYFSKCEDIEIYSEPVNEWRNLEGHNLLNLMYKDPTRWSLTFQTYVQFTMLELHNRTQHLPVKMMERSIYSARYCFVENLFRSENMPIAEYLVLDKWFQWLIKNTNTNVDLIVYLRTSPQTVYNRVLSRDRPEERSISLSFLETLHQLHEEWLLKKNFPVPAPVLTLNVDCDLKHVNEIYDHTHRHIVSQMRGLP